MESWGLGKYGITPWGGGTPELFDCVPADPPLQIIIRDPAPGATNVPVNTFINIAFYDSDDSLDVNSAFIAIDGVAVYGSGQFLNGFVGTTTHSGGVFTLQLFWPPGWAYCTRVSVQAYIANLAGECVDDTWSWVTQENPVCYTGLTPNAIELAIQQPMEGMLDLEFLRQLLLRSVLRIAGNKPINNYGNKAARVVYQLGYSTELSTLLNTYVTRRETELATTICEREKAIVIDKSLFKYEPRIRSAVTTLTNRGIVTREYVATINDYLDSVNFNFRVSTVANLVMVGKAIELQDKIDAG